VLEAAGAVRAHHDQIRRQSSGAVENLVCRRTNVDEGGHADASRSGIVPTSNRDGMVDGVT